MKWLLAILVLIAIGCKQEPAPEPIRASSKAPPKPGPAVPPPVGTASPYEMVFHRDDLEPTLKKVSELISKGFDAKQAKYAAQAIKNQKSKEASKYTFEVTYKGKKVDMVILATSGENPKLTFESDDKELLEAIDKVL